MNYNIIADVAGQYKTLLTLLEKMPEGIPLSVGDMIDRGPSSKKVIEFFRTKGEAIMGNHEHLMIDAVEGGGYYSDKIWEWNGGDKTLASFAGKIPAEVITWAKSLPYYKKIEKPDITILVTHAFWAKNYSQLDHACNIGKNAMDPRSDTSLLWNRAKPKARAGILQIAGHNSQWGLRYFDDYAICLDDSRNNRLTGFSTETMQVYQQDYIG